MWPMVGPVCPKWGAVSTTGSCFHGLSLVFVGFIWSPLVSTGEISKNEWVAWLCQLGVELLKESPSPMHPVFLLGSCSSVQGTSSVSGVCECECESDW